MPAMDRKQSKLSDQVRKAASECGISQYALSRVTGIDKAAMSRFISGERGLSIENLDALADVLNLRIVAGKPKRIEVPNLRPGRPRKVR